MHTKDMLADALMAIGLQDMSLKARGGYYHDYLSPLDLPELQLVNDLGIATEKRPDLTAAIMALRQRIINGEFDANAEEGDEWASSPDGRDAFSRLVNKR